MAASPIDPFVQSDAGQQLAQLARALGTLSPALARLGGTLDEQRKEKDVAAALTAAQEAHRLGLKEGEAVRQGLIPAHASGWFMASYRDQAGRLAADKFDSDFTAQKRQDPAFDNLRTMEDYDAYERSFRQAWSEKNIVEGMTKDPYFSQGMEHRSAVWSSSRRREFASQLDDTLKSEQLDYAHALLVNSLKENRKNGVSIETMGNDLHAEAQRLIASGLDKKKVNAMIAQVITNTADQLEDEGIIDIKNHVETAPGVLLGNDRSFSPLFEKARDEVRQQRATSDRIHKQAMEKQANIVLQGAQDELLNAEDPSTVDIKKYEKALGALSLDDLPTWSNQLRAMKRNFVSDAFHTDTEGTAADAELWVHGLSRTRTGLATQRDIALLPGLSRETRTRLMHEIDEEDKAGKRGRVARNPYYQQGRTDLLRVLNEQDAMQQYLEGNTKRSVEIDLALQDYDTSWVQWATSNPEAKEQQQLQFLQGVRDRLSQRWGAPDAVTLKLLDQPPQITQDTWDKYRTQWTEFYQHGDFKALGPDARQLLESLGIDDPKTLRDFLMRHMKAYPTQLDNSQETK